MADIERLAAAVHASVVDSGDDDHLRGLPTWQPLLHANDSNNDENDGDDDDDGLEHIDLPPPACEHDTLLGRGVGLSLSVDNFLPDADDDNEDALGPSSYTLSMRDDAGAAVATTPGLPIGSSPQLLSHQPPAFAAAPQRQSAGRMVDPGHVVEDESLAMAAEAAASAPRVRIVHAPYRSVELPADILFEDSSDPALVGIVEYVSGDIGSSAVIADDDVSIIRRPFPGR
jgi:hypothetical protein